MKPSPILFIVVALFGLNATGLAQEKKEGFKLSAEEQSILDLTNKEREKEGLKPLKPSEKLFQVARAHSLNMANQQLMEHVLDGKNPRDRVKEARYNYLFTGENIARANKDTAEALKLWLESAPHKENILRKEFTELGIGIATDERGQVYYTQVFGAPKPR